MGCSSQAPPGSTSQPVSLAFAFPVPPKWSEIGTKLVNADARALSEGVGHLVRLVRTGDADHRPTHLGVEVDRGLGDVAEAPGLRVTLMSRPNSLGASRMARTAPWPLTPGQSRIESAPVPPSHRVGGVGPALPHCWAQATARGLTRSGHDVIKHDRPDAASAPGSWPSRVTHMPSMRVGLALG
jgi:hypothetical protein